MHRLNPAEEEIEAVPAIDAPRSGGKSSRPPRPAIRPRGAASCPRRGGAARGSPRATCMPREDAPGHLRDRARRAAPSRRCRARAQAVPTRARASGLIMLASRSPADLLVRADHVELAEHVVQLRAAAKDARAGPEGRRKRRRHAGAVDHRDVRRARQRPRRRAARSASATARASSASVGSRRSASSSRIALHDRSALGRRRAHRCAPGSRDPAAAARARDTRGGPARTRG